MSPVTFENMAAEVLQQICRYLDSKSLSDFALVSKLCNSAANVYLFRNVRISVLSRKKLQLDVDRWSRTLERASSFDYVRRLELDGYMPPENEDTGKLEAIIPEHVKYAKRDHDEDDDLSVWAIERDPWYPRFQDKTPPEQSLREDGAWKPLANFIHQLPALSDLVYACTNQFTPCLLAELHQHHPECRLYISTFHFCSLNQQDTDPHEFALATSPCLYSISARYTGWDSDGIEDYNEEAVLRTASGLAPNLKHVRISSVSAGNSPMLIQAWTSGIRHPWQGFSLDTRKADVQPTKLDRLDFHDYISQELLETWNKHTVFSTLRILKLESIVTDEALSWAVVNCTFHSLTTLSLSVQPRGNRTQEIDNYYILLDLFLRGLPPLQNLRVTGRVRQNTLDTILERHGKSIHRLWLETSQEYNRFAFNAIEVNKIQQNCAMLEDLILKPIPRSKGDAQETAIYKTLGDIPKLQRITLTLDSSNFRVLEGAEFIDDDDPDSEDYEIPNDPSFDEFHQQFAYESRGYQPRKGHIRDALINSALDETLARAIFNCISNARHAFPLEYLKLHSSGGGEFGGPVSMDASGLEQAINSLGREWLLTRSPRDDSGDKVIAREIGKRSREESEGRKLHPMNQAAWLKVEPVFRRIWPEREDGTGDWHKDWYSWPLSDSLDLESL
jgi:hypothetical protein